MQESKLNLDIVRSVIVQMLKNEESALLCTLATMPEDCFNDMMIQAFTSNPLNSIAMNN